MNKAEAKAALASLKDRLSDVKGFYNHLLLFLLTSFLGILLNMNAGPNEPVVIFPIMIWAFFVIRHGQKTFGWFGKDNKKKWEKDMMRELMGEDEITELTKKLSQHVTNAGLLEDPNKHNLGELLRRLENLETIITSHDWENISESEQRAKEVEELSKKVN